MELPTVEELQDDLDTLKSGFEEADKKITVSQGNETSELEAQFRLKLSCLFSNGFFRIRFEELLRGIKYLDFNSTVNSEDDYRGLERLYWVSNNSGSADNWNHSLSQLSEYYSSS